MGRIVLFGATGYTGRLTAEALVARGQRPLLAARSGERLSQLAARARRRSRHRCRRRRPAGDRDALVEEGDVLIATVGPFAKWGDAAAEAAIAAAQPLPRLDRRAAVHPARLRALRAAGGARRDRHAHRLRLRLGAGQPRGALALRDAGPEAVRVDTGYFVTGATGASSFSGGTKASVAGVATEPAFAYRDGALRTVRSADRYRSFTLRGRELPAVTVGSSEDFALPMTHPGLRDVNSYLGWFGPLSRPMQAFSLIGGGAMRIPGVRAFEQARRALRQGLDRRPGSRAARPLRLLRRRRGLRRRGRQGRRGRT